MELEDLKEIVNECLELSYEVNDILDEGNSEALGKIQKIISNLELGVDLI